MFHDLSTPEKCTLTFCGGIGLLSCTCQAKTVSTYTAASEHNAGGGGGGGGGG